MLLFSLKFFGWLTAHTPEALLRVVSAVLGDFIYFCLPRRRRLVLSNLSHAFPEKPASWHQSIGRQSCHRLIETGLLSVATPFLGEARYRQIVAATPELLAAFARHSENPAATLICSPHLSYWEAQTAMPLVVPAPFPEFGIIFRPLDNLAANSLVQTSRERFGMKLLSRKAGFADALKILRRRGFVGVLFDQNAGLQGALTLLFDRVCATTELPGIMAEKFRARVYGIYPLRRAFWRVDIGLHPIQHDGTSTGVTIGLNRWLESLLARDDNLCASWLWAHNRWRNQDIPSRRFRLEARRDLLASDLATRGYASIPRRTRIWIRLPNWLGDVVMTLPLLRALRVSRPDAELTLVAKQQFLPLLEMWNVADQLHPLPSRGPGYFLHFRRVRGKFPDVWLLFTNSFRGDLEGWFTRCRHRFGIERAGSSRPLLTHAYHPPSEFGEQSQHQLRLWEDFLRHFGLNRPADLQPFDGRVGGVDDRLPIGLIPGSENTPEKRWPLDHWRALIAALPEERFIVFGTANDRVIAGAVADKSEGRVENLAGKTDLVEFNHRLRGCRLLVSNDTGGMHLANANGVPVIALFGPTNPVRTRPVFAAPVRILQPPGCAATGGGTLEALRPETVIVTLRELQQEWHLAGGGALEGKPNYSKE